MIKKILGFVMAMAMTLTITSAFVSAEGDMAFQPTAATAKAGETVTVDINLVNNTGVAAVGLFIDFDSALTYDEDALTLGTIFPAANSTVTALSDTQLYYATYDVKNITEDGLVCTLTFKVADDAAAGEYTITATPDPDPSFGCVDIDYNPVTIATASSKVTVEADAPAEPVIERGEETFVATATDADGFTGVKFNFTTDYEKAANTTASAEVAFGTALENGSAVVALTVKDIIKTVDGTAVAFDCTGVELY